MNNYYNIDDIITDGQKLPCNFEIDVPGLGFLQGEANTDVCLKKKDKKEWQVLILYRSMKVQN